MCHCSPPAKRSRFAHSRKRPLWYSVLACGGVRSAMISLGILATQFWTVPSAAQTTLGEGASVGVDGINALPLQQAPYNLSGYKIGIGQVEIGRPGLVGFDKIAPRNRVMMPTRVFNQDQLATPNDQVEEHSHNVAGIMISRDKALPGVAPRAKLYASAVNPLGRSGQPEECRSTNFIALQNGEAVRAINFSFGESLQQDPRPNARLDGQALLTLCVDWSARVHDVTYVIAGNQGEGGIPIPTDNFNGLNVAFSRREDGLFRKVDFANLGNELAGIAKSRVGRERNLADRRSISLVAPGSQLELLNPDGTTTIASGTSFAAPHVTGLVALLQEYAERRLQQARETIDPLWSFASRRHEVMKVILINAADKIADPGDGRALGMSRNIINQRGETWLESEAYRNPLMPLDLQMGAGQVNALRSYQLFSAGQYPLGQAIPPLGWNYTSIEATEKFQDYVFADPVLADTFLSVSLSWDRWVDLNDGNGNGEYDIGESFSDRGLNNLDLYLMPAEATQLKDSIGSSVSTVDSIEHLFYKIPRTGRYKLRVVYQQQVHSPEQAYGIAWWGVTSGASPKSQETHP
ncbi:MAG: S8 family serine peptidase [Prochlorotrichaceae cyanobacterium]